MDKSKVMLWLGFVICAMIIIYSQVANSIFN